MAINRQHWTSTTTDEVKVDTPSYYDGDNNYTAIEVVTNFNLNYNLGTACTYILRAYRKHESPNEDIQKAIDHLQFELIKLKTK
jgi:ribosome-associated translation inhibitor RaiA